MSDIKSSDLLGRLGYWPTWCPVDLAVRWAVDGKRPLSEQDCDCGLGFVDIEDARFDQVCDEFIVALRNGLLKARGDLFVFKPPHTSLANDNVDAHSVGARSEGWTNLLDSLKPEFGQPNRFHIVLVRNSEILAELWDHRLFDWRTGRSASYNWNELYTEMIVRADLDGLPATQAELVRDMAQWCQQHWGKEPADSMLKEKISPIYNHPRRTTHGGTSPESRRNLKE